MARWRRSGPDDDPKAMHSGVLRDALGVGAATGVYGLSFGALAVASGLSTLQTGALSAPMFTGASQFALVGVLGSGGNPIGAAATAILVGARNGLYGPALSPLLGLHGPRRVVAAHLVIDESAAMTLRRDSDATARLAFRATGLAVFVLWNLATIAGAVGAAVLSNPKALGLDAAAPAAFLALVAPKMRGRAPWAIALVAGAVAIALVPLVPVGVPILVAASVAAIVAVGSPHPSIAGNDGPGPQVD